MALLKKIYISFLGLQIKVLRTIVTVLLRVFFIVY